MKTIRNGEPVNPCVHIARPIKGPLNIDEMARRCIERWPVIMERLRQSEMKP